MDSSKGLAFLRDGVIYYSPNCKRHVFVPPRIEDVPYQFGRKNAQLARFQHPRWWTPPYGYLAFLPLIPNFDGAAFGCLRDIVAHICQNVDGNFVLRPEKAAEWMDLQDLLILVSNRMKNNTYFVHLGPSLAPVAPSYLGFSLPFNTPRAARLQVTIARDWFVVWMAQLSFLFAHFEHEGNTDIPRWFPFLESQGIAQSWLCGMRSSMVCDFSKYCPRVGVFLDFLENRKGQPTVDWYTSLNVPVWYPWTNKHQKAVKENPQLAYLQPPPELLQAAATFLIQTPTAILPSALLPADPRPPTYPELLPYQPPPPDPVLDNEQPYQENQDSSASSNMSGADFQATRNAYIATKPWLQFFQARDDRNKKKLASETPSQCQTRLNRQRKPPVKKVDVFLWDWSDEDPQLLVRTRVNRREGEDILESYSNSQLVYDPYSNVWDACEYFGANDDDDDDDNPMAGKSNPAPAAPAALTHAPTPSDPVIDDVGASEQAEHEAFCRDRVRLLDTKVPSERFKKLALSYSFPSNTDSNLDLTEDSFDILSYLVFHYGFVPPLPLQSNSPVDFHTWKENIKNVGLDARKNPPSADLAESVVPFLQGLRLPAGPSAELWDLHPDNYRKVDVRSSQVISKKDDNLFFVHTSALETPNGPWIIALTTAADALFVYRLLVQKDFSVVSLAELLVNEGIRFHTLQPLPPRPSVKSNIGAVRSSISIRVRDYKFGLEDYHAYVQERARILSSPRGRAALLEGGLIGRLAKEHLGHHSAALGPSSAVTQRRQGFSFTDADDITYWDDRLTDDEIHLICGMYHCYTGNIFSYFHLCFLLILL